MEKQAVLLEKKNTLNRFSDPAVVPGGSLVSSEGRTVSLGELERWRKRSKRRKICLNFASCLRIVHYEGQVHKENKRLKR